MIAMMCSLNTNAITFHSRGEIEKYLNTCYVSKRYTDGLIGFLTKFLLFLSNDNRWVGAKSGDFEMGEEYDAVVDRKEKEYFIHFYNYVDCYRRDGKKLTCTARFNDNFKLIEVEFVY